MGEEGKITTAINFKHVDVFVLQALGFALWGRIGYSAPVFLSIWYSTAVLFSVN